MTSPGLKRSLGCGLLIMFGLGNILGAGIYVLIGKVAGEAGYFAPWSFLTAAGVAAFSALSYAELASRFPDAGGEVVYLEKAFGIRTLSLGVGLLIVAAGTLSAATITRGLAGYVQVFWPAPPILIIALTVAVLAAVAVWGVRESLLIAAAFTVVEIAGLAAVIFPGALEPVRWLAVPEAWSPGLGPAALSGVVAGAFLAFYAFIGFEDMVNLAEEASHPERDMPIAIVSALVAATVLYALTVWAALAYMTPAELEESAAPLADLYQRITGRGPTILTLVAIFAVVNGALVQIIMVSRLLYGMGKRAWSFRIFYTVSERTRTPVTATITAAAIVLALAALLPVQTLAEFTSAVVLMVFVLVNVSLIVVKHRAPVVPGVRILPRWLPVVGIASSMALLLYVVLAAV